MASPPDPVGEGPPLDLARIMQTLDRHGVEYLLVGGRPKDHQALPELRDLEARLPSLKDP